MGTEQGTTDSKLSRTTIRMTLNKAPLTPMVAAGPTVDDLNIIGHAQDIDEACNS
jgi:hypothetical protein